MGNTVAENYGILLTLPLIISVYDTWKCIDFRIIGTSSCTRISVMYESLRVVLLGLIKLDHFTCGVFYNMPKLLL